MNPADTALVGFISGCFGALIGIAVYELLRWAFGRACRRCDRRDWR